MASTRAVIRLEAEGSGSQCSGLAIGELNYMKDHMGHISALVRLLHDENLQKCADVLAPYCLRVRK